MGEPLIVGRIIAILESPGVPLYTSGGGQRQLPENLFQYLEKGQILQARVVQILPDDKAILELGGKNIETVSSPQLREGQVLTVRVLATGVNLELEILSERTVAERFLATALRSIFSSADKPSAVWRALATAISNLQNVGQNVLPESQLQAIIKLLQPVRVSTNAHGLAERIQQFIKSSGLGYESSLRQAVDSNRPPAGIEVQLKPLLMHMISAFKRSGQLPTPTSLPPPAAIALPEIKALMQQFIARWSRFIPTTLFTGMESIPVRMEQMVQALWSADSMQAFDRQVSEVLNSIKAELEPLARRIGAQQRPVFNLGIRNLVMEIREQLNRNSQVHEVLARIALAQTARSATGLTNQLEALQVLNAHLQDRDLYFQFLFPASFLDELVDVHIKQFVSSGKKSKGDRKLTAVILLELESIGKIRIDALLQGKTLYINLFVQKPELIPMVEKMVSDLSEQLTSRGLVLARMNCRADEKRVEQFHNLEDAFLPGDEGLINLRI